MKIILFISLLVLGIIFANHNDMPVTVRYYNLVLEDVTLYSVILMSILLGFIGGTVYSYIESFRIKSKLKSELKLRKELEKEIENLRTLPLTTTPDIDDSDEFLQEEVEEAEDLVKASD
jgi:uncharacterized membrane protein YciS (DUF1049 family)